MGRHHNPPPGELVDLGTHRLHIRGMGHGSPTVVLDAALGASSLSWTLVQREVAQVTRVCAYDRAGFAWSEAGPLPRTASRIAEEVHQLLTRSGERPPFVLVGHSFGGLVVRLVQTRYPHLVAGLVLIEPAIPQQWANPSPEQRALLMRGTRLCGYGRTAARLGVARLVAMLARLGALDAARGIVRIVSRGGLRREDEGVLAPIWKLPREVRLLLADMWGQPKFFEALGSQIEHMCSSASDALRELPPSYGDLPLAVVSAESAEEWRTAADAALAALSTRGQHVLAPESGHWVPLDAPDIVVRTIVGIVQTVRQAQR